MVVTKKGIKKIREFGAAKECFGKIIMGIPRAMMGDKEIIQTIAGMVAKGFAENPLDVFRLAKKGFANRGGDVVSKAKELVSGIAKAPSRHGQLTLCDNVLKGLAPSK